MCRLYTFRSSHPRKIECELVRAQNSLLRQSAGDSEGRVHSDGWGLGHYRDDTPHLIRHPTAAVADESFRWAAAEAFTMNVVAHVRSATVGGPGALNTHPFQVGDWLFAHNGTIAAFPLIRDRVVAAMAPRVQSLPRGTTDSEHLFHLILSEHQRHPERGTVAAVRTAVTDVMQWAQEAAPGGEFAANIVLTQGRTTTIMRNGRSLWYVQRESVHACQVCAGELHVEGAPPPVYHAVAFASEPITTDEAWVQVKEGRLFTIDPTLALTEEVL